MVSFAEAMLKHYKKHWWQPFVSYGWHTQTTVAKAAKQYTVNLTTWSQFRGDLRDKMLVGGLPPQAPDGTVQPEVYCECCENMTAAYDPKKAMRRIEGSDFVDKCEMCLYAAL